MIKDMSVDEFFSDLHRSYQFDHHLKYPDIKKEVEEMHGRGIPTPVAAYLVFERNMIPLDYKKLKHFGVRIRDVLDAHQLVGQPNYNESMERWMEMNLLLPKEYSTEFISAMDGITPGDTSYQSISASYLIMKGTYADYNFAFIRKSFNIGEGAFARKHKDMREAGYEKAVAPLQEKLKQHQREIIISGVQRGLDPTIMFNEYHLSLRKMRKDLPREVEKIISHAYRSVTKA